MVITEQYPHYLYKRTAQGYENEEGDWVQSDAEWVFASRCREETNGAGAVIQLADMKPYKFSSLIQMPVGVGKIPEGTEVMVLDNPISEGEGESVRIKGACAKHDIGRLHCRLWV